MKPFIMIAPNGAHKTKIDIPTIPLTADEIALEAVRCESAGANGIHLHVRDVYLNHCLDYKLYKNHISKIKKKLPKFFIQVTTESAGRFNPEAQRQLIDNLLPSGASISIKEMWKEPDKKILANFYHRSQENGTEVQHIIYDKSDILLLSHAIKTGIIPRKALSYLLVLGRHDIVQESMPEDFFPLYAECEKKLSFQDCKKMLCAFGRNEISCLVTGVRFGFDCRIGFENNHLNEDGSFSSSNAERVAFLYQKIKQIF